MLKTKLSIRSNFKRQNSEKHTIPSQPKAATPTPIVAPTIECVVETGHPRLDAKRTHIVETTMAQTMANYFRQYLKEIYDLRIYKSKGTNIKKVVKHTMSNSGRF